MDILGRITLYNDDCMNIMRNMPDKAFDLAIVDPPYGIQINKSGRVGHYGGGIRFGTTLFRKHHISRSYFVYHDIKLYGVGIILDCLLQEVL